MKIILNDREIVYLQDIARTPGKASDFDTSELTTAGLIADRHITEFGKMVLAMHFPYGQLSNINYPIGLKKPKFKS